MSCEFKTNVLGINVYVCIPQIREEYKTDIYLIEIAGYLSEQKNDINF